MKEKQLLDLSESPKKPKSYDRILTESVLHKDNLEACVKSTLTKYADHVRENGFTRRNSNLSDVYNGTYPKTYNDRKNSSDSDSK